MNDDIEHLASWTCPCPEYVKYGRCKHTPPIPLQKVFTLKKEKEVPQFHVEVTRLVEWRGAVIVEAADENDAYQKAKACVEAQKVPLTTTCDFTDLGPVHRLND
jgi:hypothetical protein